MKQEQAMPPTLPVFIPSFFLRCVCVCVCVCGCVCVCVNAVVQEEQEKVWDPLDLVLKVCEPPWAG